MKNFHEMCVILDEEKEKYEEFLLWEECFSLDENWLTTPLKFVAGAAGNLVGQTGRAMGNVASGFVGDIGALGDMGLGALQVLGGGRKKGWEKIKKGWASAEDSGAKIGRGATQALGALSGITPILRGAQAASEPMTSIRGVYAPSGVNKGSFSDLFGMGPWEEPKKEEEPKKPAPQKTQKPSQKPKQDSKEARQEPLKNPESPEPNDECKHLIRLYNAVKDVKARRHLQRKMAIVDPVWYAHAMQKAKARLRKS